MRAGETWTDITILNISSHGLMARANTVPPSRSYVEIRRGAAVTIVGKVVWHDASHFGVRTQDRIGTSMLIEGSGSQAPQPNTVAERRIRPRPDLVDPAEAFERSRRRAAAFQFAFLSVAGLAGAILIGSAVMTILGQPFAHIADHLG